MDLSTYTLFIYTHCLLPTNHGSSSSSVQVMYCCPKGHVTNLIQCWLYVNWTFWSKLQWNCNQNKRKIFWKKKCIWKCLLQIISHFVEASRCHKDTLLDCEHQWWRYEACWSLTSCWGCVSVMDPVAHTTRWDPPQRSEDTFQPSDPQEGLAPLTAKLAHHIMRIWFPEACIHDMGK